MKKILWFTALFCIPVTVQCQITDYEQLISYIENPSRVEENQLPPHVPFVPFETEEQAYASKWEQSPYYRSLDGSWKFYWTKSPLQSPRDFHLPGFDASDWKEIQVPGTWQMQGFGYNIYRNVPMEFAPYDPPRVPVEFNPTGFYIREFELPDTWDGRKVVLHFDGVKAGFWVWINGSYVGFDKGSMTPAEFDISEHLIEGTNKIAIQVVRWTDGSYLEDQDMWRFAGIYRRVYLFAAPPVHIRDFTVRTQLDEGYTHANLEVDCILKNGSEETTGTLPLSARLLDPAGNEVTNFTNSLKGIDPGEEKTLSLSGKLDKPSLWSAEKPSLYTLLLILENTEGKILEVLEEKVGFRELEIRDAQMLVNGVPVVLMGVNRHEHDPERGRTMTREVIEKDFQRMKELNVNAIRTCHYPNDPLFYDLADQWGFYICDEVNAECHYGEHYLAAQAGWEDAFMDRTARYVQRDKNHPSVIMWSMGNECGLAPVHYQMAGYVRSVDPTRFIYHQTNYPNGDAPFADICGTRYPNPGMLDAIADTTTRPVILGEYAHAVGNSMGHFDDYWDRFHRHKSLQGGFIWDWVNQSIRVDLVTTKDRSKHAHQAVLMGRPKLVDGVAGKALELSGLDDFVELSPHPALELTGEELTLQAWIYPRGYRGSNTFISKGMHAFSLEQSHADSLAFTIHSGKPYRVSGYLPRNWDHQWHHVAGIYNGSEIALYLDGERLATSPASGPIDRTYYEVMVGKNHEGHHENTPGFVSNARIDEVMIHKVALEPGMLAFHRKEAVLEKHLVLWLPFEETENLGPFLCYGATPYTSATMDGVVFADRSYQPESWQVKHSHCPVKTEALNVLSGKFRIHNRFHFTNLDEISVSWTLLKDGIVSSEGTLDLALAPLQHQEIKLPLDQPAPGDRGDYILRFHYRTARELPWARIGYELGFDEFRLPLEPSVYNSQQEAATRELRVLENDSSILVTGDGFAYEFDRASGVLEQVRAGNTEFLSRSPLLKVSRPPVVNEISYWTRAEYAEWYAWGLDSLIHETEEVYYSTNKAGTVSIQVRVNSYSFLDRTLQFNQEYTYRIRGDGLMVLDHRVECQMEKPARRPSEDIPWFQKVGLEMKLDPGVEHVRWYGKGPFETYPDRHTGAKTGIYGEELDSIQMPYVITQGFGNRTGVRWLELMHESGAGLRFESTESMNFSIDPYHKLEGSWYPYQLTRSRNPTLNLDHHVSGVGGTPITVRHAHRTYPDTYDYRVRIMPVSNKDQ